MPKNIYGKGDGQELHIHVTVTNVCGIQQSDEWKTESKWIFSRENV